MLNHAMRAALIFAVIVILMLATVVPVFAEELIMSVDPLVLEKGGFTKCPVPTCHAPCNPTGFPEVECQFKGGSQAPTTYACCCCGTTGNSYQRLDASWAQYGFVGAHSSFNSSEIVLTPTNVGALVPIGQADLGLGAPAAPVVANGVAYVATGGSILAIDVKTRAQIWSSLSCNGSPAAEVAYANNRVFAGDFEGDLAAYDAATGALLWCRDAGGSIQSAPAVDGNTVYISTQGDVVAVDQATGNGRWRFTVTGTPGPSSSPAVGSQIYVTGPGAVYAIRKSDGRLLWKRALGGSYTLSAPAVSGDTVYVGADGLYALAAGDGKIRWTSHAAGVNVSMPAISGSRLFVNSQDPLFGLFALSAGNGSLVWRSTSTGESLTSPSVANGVVYDISEFGELVVLDAATGAVLNTLSDQSSRPFAGGRDAQPAVVNGVVYAVTGDMGGANALDEFAMAPPPHLRELSN